MLYFLGASKSNANRIGANMEYVAIITVIILLHYFYLGLQSGMARTKAGLQAPAVTGDELYERKFRIHQNTMEQLVGFLPAMWMFAYYVNPVYGALLGVVFLIGRIVYSASYSADPAKRGAGFAIGFLAMVTGYIGTLIGTIGNLI
jgi:uncharacterized membrane protein YecN with MAPEG domain